MHIALLNEISGQEVELSEIAAVINVDEETLMKKLLTVNDENFTFSESSAIAKFLDTPLGVLFESKRDALQAARARLMIEVIYKVSDGVLFSLIWDTCMYCYKRQKEIEEQRNETIKK